MPTAVYSNSQRVARLKNAGMPVKFGRFGPLKATRFRELKYQFLVDHWRFIDASDGAVVGPQYETEAALMADLERYAESFGCV